MQKDINTDFQHKKLSPFRDLSLGFILIIFLKFCKLITRAHGLIKLRHAVAVVSCEQAYLCELCRAAAIFPELKQMSLLAGFCCGLPRTIRNELVTKTTLWHQGYSLLKHPIAFLHLIR